VIQALQCTAGALPPHLHAVQGALQQQLFPPAAAAAAEWLSANNKTAQHKARRSAQKHKQLNAYSSVTEPVSAQQPNVSAIYVAAVPDA
jgi:succinyl-CoA synthetase alpha subunit